MTENSLGNIFGYVICLVSTVAIAIYLIRSRPASSSETDLALEQIAADVQSIKRMIADQRGLLNDTHKQIRAVSKGLGKPSS